MKTPLIIKEAAAGRGALIGGGIGAGLGAVGSIFGRDRKTGKKWTLGEGIKNTLAAGAIGAGIGAVSSIKSVPDDILDPNIFVENQLKRLEPKFRSF